MLDINVDDYIITSDDITLRCKQRHQELMIKSHNDLEISEEQWIAFIQKEQRETLNNWIVYLNKLDCRDDIKKWVLDSILKISYLDKSTWKFKKRNKNTISPFVEINSIAVLMSIEQKDSKSNVSFRKLYEKNLKQVLSNKSDNGIWVRYNFNELNSLGEDINGWFTGWCITNYDVALVNLLAGDIFVFYSQIADEFVYPRIAIGMNKGKVRVCVGTLENQAIEQSLLPILATKLSTIDDDKNVLDNENIIKLINK